MGLPAGQLFKNMKLDKPNVFSLFQDPSFVKWVQYADDLSTKSSPKESSVISTLTSLYGDIVVYEGHLSSRNLNFPFGLILLTKAQTRSDTKNLAAKLQAAQFETWVRKAATQFPNLESTATKLRYDKASTVFASKESPEKLFKLLALDSVGKNLLSDTLFHKWMRYRRYRENFNKANPRCSSSKQTQQPKPETPAFAMPAPTLPRGSYLLLFPEDVEGAIDTPAYAMVKSSCGATEAVILDGDNDDKEKLVKVPRTKALARKVDRNDAEGQLLGTWIRQAVCVKSDGRFRYGQVTGYSDNRLTICTLSGPIEGNRDAICDTVYPVVALVMGCHQLEEET
ncbi:uncharacterized protein PITG_16710 [Phytophthora infestans T30-4]|uniref:Uncharacterized protein n=1 Tax=Phytophthora infestans (strain T30-4) TaxID=403677 RepID=D0NVF7_PHYIT|nr:uncharacterized protein PITG_16710 [Phytophthora infestans T30-4]EEY66634.1 conserved hypothetical protein [Phytophthora infestans T30-4]|eukprot:XP_002896935.1 conserved hypothetical protein [Phytophthora infestans T30-4]